MPFSSQRLVEVIRAKAIEVRFHGEERIRLAAFLFAGCRKLEAEDRSAETGFNLGEECWRFEEALQHLSELNRDSPIGEIFRKLLAGLLAIDQSFKPDQRHPQPFHPALIDVCTRLDVPDDPDPILQGVVHHWVNIPSLIRRARKMGRRHRGAQEFLDPVLQNLEYLTLHMRSSERPELCSVRHEILPRRTQLERSGALLRQGDFRVAFCPLIGKWRPLFEIVEGVQPPSFRAREEGSMAYPFELEAHLVELFSLAAEEDVRALVFPELSLDEERRLVIENMFRHSRGKLLTVLAGTFHTSDRPKPFNELAVLDAGGFRYWRQRKNSRYLIPAGENLDGFFPGWAADSFAQDLPEFIKYGEELLFFDCPLGRVVVLICTDALDKRGLGYLSLVMDLRPELIVVLSMSNVTQDFWNFADDMVRQGVGVAFLNAACVWTPTKGPDLFFLDLATRETRVSPPNRWRWAACDGPPSWYNRRSKAWVPLDPQDEHSRKMGVWRLAKGGTVYGVAVDFAKLLRELLE